ncbi:DUF927 domain-containing protein [Nevskia ramosa]|uniref:DUF927 domain-containing protein n=1 Tax=Nevskia ramosa TaxID=64002 RepID=UPI0003B36AD0|nr:DUF927 domain-containing protein [Nevskia ramosa]
MSDARPLTYGEIADQFRTAMHAAGIETDATIDADGKLHRFRVTGDRRDQRNGWYVLHSDGVPAGEFGCWKRGLSETWHANIGRELDEAERETNRARLEAIRRDREAETQRVRAEARNKAAKLWEEANPKPSAKHPYLAKKQVRGYGIRQLGKALVIPVSDADGALHGLQFIQENGTKRFTSGMEKAGHYHAIGEPGAVLLIAEGYATAATLREATGQAVAVAFDTGNLRPVALALRAKFPAARIVIAADNDHRTEGNPGITKATEAAQAVGGSVIAPSFPASDSGSDWNDYAAVHGLAAVRAAFETAGADKADAPAAPVVAPEASPAARTKPAEASGGGRQPRFTRDDRGIWHNGTDPKDGTPLAPQWVCPPIEVAAYLRDLDGTNWGRLLSFNDADGTEHRWGMPMRLLSGGGDEMRAELLRLGFDVPTTPRIRNLLTDYFQQSRPEARARCVERAGWHGRVFVMPDRTLGEADEAVLFQSETAGGHVYRARGDLSDWRSDLADLCRGNSRLLFAVSAAFAGPLLHWAGEESGGFNLRGSSSMGKTTALRAAASVWGSPEFMRRWRATDNALESIAAQYSDSILLLDELKQIDPKIAGETAYMLANGEGKARAGRSGSLRAPLTWRLLFLSAGELSLAEHMRQGGKQAHAGQETRMADIPAEPVTGSRSLYESLHGKGSGAEMALAITRATADVYGVAGPAFLGTLLPRVDTLPDAIRALRNDFTDRHVPKRIDGQVARVAGRFALVAAAGELATSAGITGWDAGEADAACGKCFAAWIESRGGTGNLEPVRMLTQVRRWLESEGSARLQHWGEDASSKDWVTVKRAGFRCTEQVGDEGETYYLLPETFDAEICTGFDPRQVAQLLASVGALKRPKEPNRLKCRTRLPSIGLTWCYVVLPSIWQAEPDDAESGA